MDIPELIRQLLELKFQIKDEYSMQIIITTSNILRVRFWMEDGEYRVTEMNLANWSTGSRDFLSHCRFIAESNNLLDEQQILPLN